ncbi:MAG: DUF7219 family protein [Thainema sp.]
MNTDNHPVIGKQEFLQARSQYYGEFSPEQLAFNINLQEFAHQVSYLCALETGGKIPAGEAYQGIKQAWKELKRTKKGLGIADNESSQADEA